MKADIERLFQERYSRFMQDAIRYWQIIFKSGVAFLTMMFVLSAMIYYQQLIERIPSWFPLTLAFALLFTFLVTRGRHRTFIQEADLVFLTPIEGQMKSYFSKAYLYNFVLQGTVIFLVLLILFPLYQARVGDGGGHAWFYFLFPLALKGWNLHLSWSIIHVTSRKIKRFHALLRGAFNFVLLYWFFHLADFSSVQSLAIGGITLAGTLVVFYLFDTNISKSTPVNWYELVRQESILDQQFYQFVSAFIDVSKLPRSVKKRSWLSRLVKRLSYGRKSAYRSLYLYHFIRTGDHFGRYWRLTLIGVLTVLLSGQWYLKLLSVAFFLLITRIQLKGIEPVGHHLLLNHLVPLTQQEKKEAFNWTLCFLLLIQLMILGLSFVLSVLAI